MSASQDYPIVDNGRKFKMCSHVYFAPSTSTLSEGLTVIPEGDGYKWVKHEIEADGTRVSSAKGKWWTADNGNIKMGYCVHSNDTGSHWSQTMDSRTSPPTLVRDWTLTQDMTS